MVARDFEKLIGRKIVFSVIDDETHKRIYLQEGEVQQTVDNLVKISGCWYRDWHLVLEAVLPAPEPSSNFGNLG